MNVFREVLDNNIYSGIKTVIFTYCALESAGIISLCSGLQKACKYLTYRNEIYAAGLNNDGCLGVGKSDPVNEFEQVPVFLDENDEIDLLSNGICSNHTFLVTKNKKIYVWGNNYTSQFGIADEYESTVVIPQNYPMLDNIFNEFKIKKIECGRFHTLFLCTNGKLFSCGSNKHGNCGLDVNDIIYEPQIIEDIDEPIYEIAVGAMHNLCLSIYQHLWCFGRDHQGCLGLGNDYDDMEEEENNRRQCIKPNIHPFFVELDIEYIRCGEYHSMCISYENHCYLFGDNNHEQIYRPNGNVYMDYYNTPYLYEYEAINGWCGQNHSIILCNENYLISFGDNQFDLYGDNLKWIEKDEMIINVIGGSQNTLLICCKFSNYNLPKAITMKTCNWCYVSMNKDFGGIDEDDGQWYCNQCWNAYQA